MNIIRKTFIFVLSVLIFSINLSANPFKAAIGEIETGTREVPRESADGMEIVISGDDGKLYVFKNDRTILSSIWPKDFGSERIVTSPFLFDYDKNKENEIAVGTVNDSGEYKLYLINKNGENIGSTPVDIGYDIGADIILEDINQDGNPEWIIPDKAGKLNVLNFDGTLFKQLSLDASDKQLFVSSHNLDNDENKELIISSTDGKLFVLKYNNETGDFENFTGFPKDFAGKSFYSCATVFNNNEELRIILVSYNGEVFIINPLNGNIELSFSLPAGVKVISSSIIGQFDSDNEKEIGVITVDDNCFIYDLDGNLVKRLNSGYNFTKNKSSGRDFNGDENPEIFNLIKKSHLWLYQIAAGQTELSAVEWGEYKHLPGIKLYDETAYENKFFSPDGDESKDSTDLGYFRTYKENDDNTIIYTYLRIFDKDNLRVKNMPLKITDEPGSGNAAKVEWRGYADEDYKNGDYTNVPVSL